VVRVSGANYSRWRCLKGGWGGNFSGCSTNQINVPTTRRTLNIIGMEEITDFRTTTATDCSDWPVDSEEKTGSFDVIRLGEINLRLR